MPTESFYKSTKSFYEFTESFYESTESFCGLIEKKIGYKKNVDITNKFVK